MNANLWRRALVVGLGESGVEACRLLRAVGVPVCAYDQASPETLASALDRLPKDVELHLGPFTDALFRDISLVVTSPGVPPTAPPLAQARTLGLPVIPEVELAFRFAENTPIVGITGSNGKSTVTELIGHILRTAGRKVGVGANFGKAASALVLQGGWDVLVWELSSFQLEFITNLRPRVAVLTNFSPDHLDRHRTAEAYLRAKAKICQCQTPEDIAVLNADDPVLSALAVPSQRWFFSLTSRQAQAYYQGAHLVLEGKPLLNRKDLPLLGDHSVANALAAALACRGVGVSREDIRQALATCKPLPHRHELVAEINGVRFVDDSKGTNVGAVVAGLSGYPSRRVHLILGGLSKGQDFSPLVPIVREKVARVYLIGEAADSLRQALQDVIPTEMCGTLAVAVERAKAFARAGDVVLLSPACASFDQFENYAHRGKEFANLVTGEKEGLHAKA